MMRRFIVIFAGVMFLTISSAVGAAPTKPTAEKFQYPFLNYHLPMEKRLDDLMSRLTLEEKVSLLTETSEAIPRLGVEKYYHGNEALHGVVRPGTATVFPQAIALASTWDPELIHRVATAISDEARGKNNANNRRILALYSGLMTFWSPTVNMARDPRWGRTPETYGEDPWLTSRIGVAFVTGLQGDNPRYVKVVSTPKHYAANNEEHNRMECNAVISERDLRDYYLPGFQACITEGRAQSIMAAYNAVNGVPCNANRKLLTDILRYEWKFNGYVVTDCAALDMMMRGHKYATSHKESAAYALNAGIDLECGNLVYKNALIPAFKSGLVTEDAISKAAYRVLRGRFRLGLFDPPDMVQYNKIPGSVVGSKKHVALALETSHKSIVLLRNEPVKGGKLLPIRIGKVKTIAVLGPNAAVARFGDYSGSPANAPVTPLDGIKKITAGKVKIIHGEWISSPSDNEYANITGDNLKTAEGGRGLKAEYFENSKLAGEPAGARDEDSVNIDTLNHPPDPIIPRGMFSARWTGKLNPSITGEYKISINVEGNAKLFIGGELVFERKTQKMQTFKAGRTLDLDKANKNRIERMSKMVKLEAGHEYDIRLEYGFVDRNAVMQLQWNAPSEKREEAVAKQIESIRGADLAIVFLGIGLDQEREGIDRADFNLPRDQEDYIKKVMAVNPNTVVVLVNGSSMSINWIHDNVPAIVEMWYSGEQGGNGVADVLFGNANPGGRLPLTFYKSVADLPAFDDYAVEKGRTYMYFDKEPLYPFGYGLSYTTFSYDNVKLDKKAAKKSDTVNVSVKVRNNGKYDGDEVVQLYVKNLDSKEYQPNLQLRGFKRIFLKKGQSKNVVIPLKIQNLSYWNDGLKQYVVDEGSYDIMIGTSSKDIRLRDRIVVK